MIYIDENLCTGCGLCLDACKQGALSLRDNVVMVDAELCTSCNRCVAMCITGAIRSAELLPVDTPTAVLCPSVYAPAAWSETSPLVADPLGRLQQTGPSPLAAPAPSRLASAEKILSALAGLVIFALERKDRGASPAGGCSGQAKGMKSPGSARARPDGSGRGGRGRKRHRDNRCRAAGGGTGT